MSQQSMQAIYKNIFLCHDAVMKWNQMMMKRREAYPKIVADYEAGISAVDLAHKYNLSRQRIHQILVMMRGAATPAKGKRRKPDGEASRKPQSNI